MTQAGGGQDLVGQIAELAAAEFKELFARAAADLADASAAGVLAGMEQMARQAGTNLAQAALQIALDAAGPLGAGRATCPDGHQARFSAVRPKQVRTLVGPVVVDRAYHHCAACRTGVVPADALLGIAGTGLSPGLVKTAVIAGIDMPFAKAERFIDEVTGQRLASAKTIDRATKTTGAQAGARAELEAQAVKVGTVLAMPPPGTPDICYLVIDGTGAPMLPSQTRDRPGKQPDGRAKTREVKVACLFTTSAAGPDHEPVQDKGSASYRATFKDADGFADMLKTEYLRRGYHNIRQTVVLGDGAKWIWNIADRDYPAATHIVDYYHASEHVHDLAKLLDPILEDRAAWTQARLDDLYQGRTWAIEQAVDLLNLPETAPHLITDANRQVGYFTGNHHRMQYAHFEKPGMFIGSGFVESACNTIVAQRAKQAGMHWTTAGLTPILELRSLRQSHRDHIIWHEPHNQTPSQTAV